MGRKAVYLNEDEAAAMDAVMQAHEFRTSVTAASSGIGQGTLESLLAKGRIAVPGPRPVRRFRDDLR